MARTDSDAAGEAARSDASTPTGSRVESRVTPRGEDRRQAIIEAAAAIIRESGPSAQRVRFILQATLPAHGAYFGHYLQLISASQASPVKHAYRQGRQRLNAALRRVLRQLDSPLEPEMVIAIVDGAAVTALSEGWNVKSTAAALLTDLISLARGMPPFQAPGATVVSAPAPTDHATQSATVESSGSAG